MTTNIDYETDKIVETLQSIAEQIRSIKDELSDTLEAINEGMKREESNDEKNV